MDARRHTEQAESTADAARSQARAGSVFLNTNSRGNMPKDIIQISPAAQARVGQIRALLLANDIPRPHIIYIEGRCLIPFMESIERKSFPKDGTIFHEQLYRFNLDTGRFRKVEPRLQGE